MKFISKLYFGLVKNFDKIPRFRGDGKAIVSKFFFLGRVQRKELASHDLGFRLILGF